MTAHDPDHYKVGGIESIDVIRAKLSPEAFQGFCAGNVMKYMHRMGHKGASIDDAKKAQEYLVWLVESMEEAPPRTWSLISTDEDAYPWAVVDSIGVEYDRYPTWAKAGDMADSLNDKAKKKS